MLKIFTISEKFNKNIWKVQRFICTFATKFVSDYGQDNRCEDAEEKEKKWRNLKINIINKKQYGF
ncbi:hypothetical protein AGMMS49982_09570 [Bacteroidia bacterium]|nr:hypothetical protein AGMMS49982_09570 [Bacteroidia bacterium]